MNTVLPQYSVGVWYRSCILTTQEFTKHERYQLIKGAMRRELSFGGGEYKTILIRHDDEGDTFDKFIVLTSSIDFIIPAIFGRLS